MLHRWNPLNGHSDLHSRWLCFDVDHHINSDLAGRSHQRMGWPLRMAINRPQRTLPTEVRGDVARRERLEALLEWNGSRRRLASCLRRRRL